MTKEEALNITDEIREECSSHVECDECPFVLDDIRNDGCIFSTGVPANFNRWLIRKEND